MTRATNEKTCRLDNKAVAKYKKLEYIVLLNTYLTTKIIQKCNKLVLLIFQTLYIGKFSIFGVFLQRFSPELISWQAAITPNLNSQLQLTLDFYDLPKNCQNRLK